MKDERCGLRRDHAIGDDHPFAAAVGPADTAGAQPLAGAELIHKRHRQAAQQRRRDAFHLRRVDDPPAGQRLVECQAELQIPRRRHRGDAARQPRHDAGERVGAAVAADQRHGDGTVFGNGDDGRLVLFWAEERGDRADQNAAGAETEDRAAGGEQPGDMRRGAVVTLVPVAGIGARSMQLGAGERRAQLPADRCGGGA